MRFSPTCPHKGDDAGEYQTSGQVKEEFFGSLASTQKDYALKTDEFIAQDDKVIMVGSYGATVNATGKRFDPLVHGARLDDPRGQSEAFRELHRYGQGGRGVRCRRQSGPRSNRISPTAGPQNSMTGADRRFCSRIWRGSLLNPDFLEACFINMHLNLRSIAAHKKPSSTTEDGHKYRWQTA